ncbi:MAG: hypothetical protein ABIZ56_02345 [Chthoniobacteraceae bacterium]
MTSPFFEGQAAGNEKAARGYSRDQRSACIARVPRRLACPPASLVPSAASLVCTPEGLPLSFAVCAGNGPEVTSVEEIVEKMEGQYGPAQRVWVMDRGMVSEKKPRLFAPPQSALPRRHAEEPDA